MIGGSVQLCYDQEGYKYDIPVFVINEPAAYEVVDNALENVEDKSIKVKLLVETSVFGLGGRN